MTEHIQITREGPILVLAFNRPEKKNAITRAMYQTIAENLDAAQSDPSVRCVVIRGNGGVFTAGNDLGDFAAANAGTDERTQGASTFLQALARAEKPLVAAVQGFAIGVGVTLLLHCDLVYVADDARLQVPFVNLALVPEAASSMLLPARVGHARAYAMFALGEPVEGRRAAEIGIANAAGPAAQVDEMAMAAARRLAAQPLGALVATKRLMRDSARILEVMNAEMVAFNERLRSPEAAEAFAAFAERRAPDFARVA